FQLSVSVSVPLEASMPRQQLDAMVQPGRQRAGTRLTAAQIRQRLGTSFYEPIPLLLAARDSLLLTVEQAAALTAIGERYKARTGATWDRVASRLASEDAGYAVTAVRAAMREATGAALDELESAAGAVLELLNP